MYEYNNRGCYAFRIYFELNISIMKKNMGTADRIIRIVIAVVFAVLFYTQTVTGTLGFVLLGLGLVFLITSLFSFCPLYLPFGLRTCKKE